MYSVKPQYRTKKKEIKKKWQTGAKWKSKLELIKQGFVKWSVLENYSLAKVEFKGGYRISTMCETLLVFIDKMQYVYAQKQNEKTI